MNFFRRRPPAEPPKQDLKQVTATPQPRPEQKTKVRNPDFNVLSKKDDIPQHSAVLSVTGGAIELPAEWQKNYAILLTGRDKKEVQVIASVDVIRRGGLDDDYLAIIDRIKRSGFARTGVKLLAKPEIIQIIYEHVEQKRSAEEQQKAATKIQLEFDELLVSALKTKASDIHIEVTRKGAEVRFRVNGALQTFEEWPVRHARTMAGVIYMVIAEEKDTSFDERIAQSAIIDRDLGEWGSVRVRLNTLPNYPAGFDMIMRILKMGQSGDKIDLNKLGYSREQLSKTRRAVAKPQGAIIMAGTTGSGKSTSLNAMLSEKIAHHQGRIKVITVEDPPEYTLEGATQVPIVRSRSAAKEGADVNPFASTVRAAMRSDPDILMIGEVRDHHSAELLIHAVQSGHQVFSTIHASSGIDVISRLRSNGVTDDVLGGHNFIAALMYQTLVQTVCKHCSTDFEHFKKHVHDEASEDLIHRVYRYLGSAQAKHLRFIDHKGCPHCRNGVTGRTVAAEVILPDAYMRRAFRENQDSDAMMHYAYNGGKFALHHGIEKLLQGQCDILDVEHKLDQIAALQEMAASVKFFVAQPSYASYINAQTQAEADRAKDSSDSPKLILPESVQAEVDEKASAAALASELPVIHVESDEQQQTEAKSVETEQLIDRAVNSMPEDELLFMAVANEAAVQEAAVNHESSATEETVSTIAPNLPPLATALVLGESYAVQNQTLAEPEAPESVSCESRLEGADEEASEKILAKAVEEIPESAANDSAKDRDRLTPILLKDLLAVLNAEVKRTGITLSGRFFKNRLTTSAITTLISSENTQADLRRSLEASFKALDEASLDKVLSTPEDELQALIEDQYAQTQSATIVVKPVEQAVTAPKASASKAKTPAKPVTSIDKKRPAAKAKVPAKPKAPRPYKSKLLSAASPEGAATEEQPSVKPKTEAVVKSLADARSRKATGKRTTSDKGDQQ